jgi:glycosyltransferase involved in cell wall biosynthesis
MEGRIRSAVSQYGLDDRVRLVPPVSQGELARWMNSADCLVLSSAFEGMPRVVVESLRCGLPVVSTDVGETRRLVGDSAGGRLVSERTPEGFRRAVSDLLARPPSREQCRRQAAPFTARAVLEPVYAAYRQLEQGAPFR